LWKKADNNLGLVGVKLEVVISLIGVKFWPLVGTVSGRCFPVTLLWTVERMEGLGEIPVLLQDDNYACGNDQLLEVVVQALPSCSFMSKGKVLDLVCCFSQYRRYNVIP
jgi:hypothetical protein